MAKVRILYGYCALTADFLHIGHINYLLECREKCKWLIVGIMSDDCVEKYKGRKPIMNQNQRADIVRYLSMVDEVWLQKTFEFPRWIIKDYNFTIFDSDEHKREGADIIIPYTKGISSTLKRAGL